MPESVPVVRALLVEDNAGDRRLFEEHLADTQGVQLQLSHATRIEEAIELLRGQPFDLVFLDLLLPDGYGLDGLVRIRSLEHPARVVILTGIDDVVLATRALREGAADYLVKGRYNGDSLRETIEHALRGEARPARAAESGVLDSLTEREREIVSLVAEGNELMSVAYDLGISVHTVRNHIKNVYKKLGVHSQIELLNVLHRKA